jgi:NitT/TauT family transport system ATP-binding protein
MSVALEQPGISQSPPRSAATLLELRDVSKRFENGTAALLGFNLTVPRGSFISLLGASGCGKSTVLKLVAGLQKPTTGSVHWPQSEQRPRLSYVFQEPTLMPWASALKNVMLPLSLNGLAKKDSEARARQALRDVGLADFAEAYPRELSGGMKMRVSLARAIVTQPEILLLDEPFAALDEITRAKLNSDLAQLWSERKFTAIFVTHSVLEATYLSQRVIVMAAAPGRIYADFPIPAEAERDESLRASPVYFEICAALSAKLREAMT